MKIGTARAALGGLLSPSSYRLLSKPLKAPRLGWCAITVVEFVNRDVAAVIKVHNLIDQKGISSWGAAKMAPISLPPTTKDGVNLGKVGWMTSRTGANSLSYYHENPRS